MKAISHPSLLRFGGNYSLLTFADAHRFEFKSSSAGIGVRARVMNRSNFLSMRRQLPPICGMNVAYSPERSSRNALLQVVLVSPQIPGNTGSIARTCAASAVGLHLVEPLGFPVDDTKLKRAGLDYWPYVVVRVHPSWPEFRDYFLQQEGEKRLLAFTKRGTRIHSVSIASLYEEIALTKGVDDEYMKEFSYKRGDWLLFGSETSGLPPEVLSDCKNEAYGGGTINIPMVSTYVRCLNLSVSVGVAVYEASRQLNYEPQLLSSSDEHTTCFREDIFG